MVHIHVNKYKHMAMHKQVDPLPIGARYYYKSERVQVVDYHPLFAREYVVTSLVTGGTRRVFRNELLRVPIDYPPPPPPPPPPPQQEQPSIYWRMLSSAVR